MEVSQMELSLKNFVLFNILTFNNNLPVEKSGSCDSSTTLGGYIHGCPDGRYRSDHTEGQGYGGIDVGAFK